MYSSSEARRGNMVLLDPPVICETWDTPYIYHADDICMDHLPEGSYVDEEGNLIIGDGPVPDPGAGAENNDNGDGGEGDQSAPDGGDE